MTRAEKIRELEQVSQEWECTMSEAAYGLLSDFYEAAGFAREPLSAELCSMSDQQIIEAFLNIN